MAEGESFYTTALGLKAAQDMLTAHPDINVLVGADQAVNGALQAVGPGRPRSSSSATAAAQVAIQDIVDGKQFGTVVQAPATEGRLGVEQLVQAIRTGTRDRGYRYPGKPARRRRRHQGQRRDSS